MSAHDQNASARNEYRAHLVEARERAQADYDKTLVLLAGGVLGLSVTFMHDMVGAKTPRGLCNLEWGWGLLVFSLLCILVSFFLSRMALGSAIRALDSNDKQPHVGRWTTATEWSNIIAGVCFIVGTSLVTRFACLNLGAVQ